MTEGKITKELIEEAKLAASPEALLALAEEKGVTLTEESARKYYEMWHVEREISDEELDNVAGGGCGDVDTSCRMCGGSTSFIGHGIEGSDHEVSRFCCNVCGHEFWISVS